MNDYVFGGVIGFVIGILLFASAIHVFDSTYTDGQIDALSGNNIMVEKTENERGEIVWQLKDTPITFVPILNEKGSNHEGKNRKI